MRAKRPAFTILRLDGDDEFSGVTMPCCHPFDMTCSKPAETFEQAHTFLNAWRGRFPFMTYKLVVGRRVHQPIKVQTEFDLLSAIDWRELEAHRLHRNKI